MSLDPVTAIADLAKTAVDKIWPDKTEEEKAKLAAAVTLVQGQLQINAEEAKHASLFVAGWRPFIGWVCGMALVFQFILRPLLIAMALKVPALDVTDLITILLGMLGLGGMRTYEKFKGVA